jgi:hypothetical protein
MAKSRINKVIWSIANRELVNQLLSARFLIIMLLFDRSPTGSRNNNDGLYCLFYHWQFRGIYSIRRPVK